MPPKPMPFDPVIGAEICEAFATSSLGLDALCKANPHWPSRKVIIKWRLDPSLSFGEDYARAKQAQIDLMVERIFTITKDRKQGYLTDKDGNSYADQTYLTKMRCEIDAIKWLAGKLAPKIYGDKKDSAQDNGDALSQFRVEDK